LRIWLDEKEAGSSLGAAAQSRSFAYCPGAKVKRISRKMISNLTALPLFAGYDEPTMNPDFDLIICETTKLQDVYAPKAPVSVLSNGSMHHKPSIIQSLNLADIIILKPDGETEDAICKINMPHETFRPNEYLKQLKRFKGNKIIQDLFVRGKYTNEIIDYTTQNEIHSWAKLLLLTIRPQKFIIYAIERATPAKNPEKISLMELENNAKKVATTRIKSEVFA
jgi:wyosine [tRNA(Phe)-imidazoG37] synthetase (radical SAM superfamily)